MKKTKLIGVLLSVLMLLSCVKCPTFALDSGYISMYVGVPVAVVDGAGCAIDSSGKISPYIKNDRTMLPVRFVAQSLGAEVDWNAESRTVTVKKDSGSLSMVIGENVMYKDSQPVALDAACEITNERTMVPVRAIAEGFNMSVIWNDGFITIYNPNGLNDTEKTELEKKAVSDIENLCRAKSIKPLALNISWGGQMLKDFDPMQNTYTIRPENQDISKLHISVIADEYSNATVEMPKSIPGEIRVKVCGKVFSGLENIYTIKVKEPAPFKVFAKGTQAGNGPENTFDDDFSTRWAAEGDQWIMYALNESTEISKVKIAFWKASETRKASFRIQVRNDPSEEWVTVFKGKSTYSTEELETFEFEKRPVKFIRIYGYGNTENKWNSILEVKFE